jgi:hypothetical protein
VSRGLNGKGAALAGAPAFAAPRHCAPPHGAGRLRGRLTAFGTRGRGGASVAAQAKAGPPAARRIRWTAPVSLRGRPDSTARRAQLSPQGTRERLGAMPGGKRTDHISTRDLEVLDFIVRFGVVPRRAVAVWAGTARTVTIVREGRLRRAELIRVLRGYGSVGPVSVCTTLGVRVSGRAELRPARLSFAALSHDTVVAELAAGLERDGARLLSEREILAAERAAGDHPFSARLPNGSLHRPDLIRIDAKGAAKEAIEVELSTKGAARLDEILRAWRRAVLEQRVDRVVYRCAPQTLRNVRQAVERTKAESVILVEDLKSETAILAGTASGIPELRAGR